MEEQDVGAGCKIQEEQLQTQGRVSEFDKPWNLTGLTPHLCQGFPVWQFRTFQMLSNGSDELLRRHLWKLCIAWFTLILHNIGVTL